MCTSARIIMGEYRGTARRRGSPLQLYLQGQSLEPVKEDGSSRGGGNPMAPRVQYPTAGGHFQGEAGARMRAPAVSQVPCGSMPMMDAEAAVAAKRQWAVSHFHG